MKNKTSTRSRGLFHKDNMQDTILLCLFIAIILVLAFTPLGMIQLPLIKATILHVPVIIGSVLFGPKKGAVLGFLFGLCSFVSNTFTPTARPLRQWDFTRPTAVIMGNEHSGVAEELIQAADGELYIPMYGMIQSFNVSVASAIILSEACRQREAAGFYDSPRLEPDELERRLALWLKK